MPVEAADAAGSHIAGNLIDANNGLAVSGATVTLYQGTTKIATTTSDANGSYTFDVAPGIYAIEIRAQGLQVTRLGDIVADPNGTATIRTPVAEARTSTEVREIGRVSTAATSNTLASTSTIQHDLDPVQLQNQGFVKAADALATIPGVNLSGGPHAVGDDTFIDIRGAGPSETRTLLDGHPIGPGGAIGLNGNSQNFVYNFANSPYELMDNLQVSVGSGASGLYGVNAIGGTINFQSLSPTTTPHSEFQQQVGGSGLSSTIIKTTGSAGHFGYALGYAVNGTYGDYAPQQIFQSARPNNNANAPNGGACTAPNDLTSCNQALNTYAVSGNYLVATNLEKLRYTFAPGTALTLTSYNSNERADSTGNGDNDYLPYNTRLAAINAGGLAGSGGCAANLYPVITDANPNACYTAQQWASASYGPDGGGATRTRGVRLYDYDARFTTSIGVHNIAVDSYSDFYQYHKESNQSSGLDPTGTFFAGNAFSNNFNTHGTQISDDIATGNNDFGFGWFTYHQLGNGNNFSVDANNNPIWTPYADSGTGQYSYFIRDIYSSGPKLTTYLNAWLTRSQVVNQTKFDPRLSFVYKVTPNDVVRLTGGQTDGFPNASLESGGVQSIGANLSSLGGLCPQPGAYGVASASNPNLTSEVATDVEASYGHRFWSDTSFNVVGYVSSEKNQLYQATAPLTSLPASIAANPVISNLLSGFAQKITSNCNLATPLTTTTVQQYLGVQTTINVASAMYRGLEFQGRVRANRNFYLDYSYQIATAQQFGVPASVLQNAGSAFVTNGGQIYEIPLTKGSAALDFQDLKGLEVQLDGSYIGKNNTLNRPAYTSFNAFVSKRFNKTVSLVVSGTNIFNQNVQTYGYFGQQVLGATNPNFSYTNPIDQAVGLGYSSQTELLGLPPAVVSATLTFRI